VAAARALVRALGGSAFADYSAALPASYLEAAARGPLPPQKRHHPQEQRDQQQDEDGGRRRGGRRRAGSAGSRLGDDNGDGGGNAAARCAGAGKDRCRRRCGRRGGRREETGSGGGGVGGDKGETLNDDGGAELPWLFSDEEGGSGIDADVGMVEGEGEASPMSGIDADVGNGGNVEVAQADFPEKHATTATLLAGERLPRLQPALPATGGMGAPPPPLAGGAQNAVGECLPLTVDLTAGSKPSLPALAPAVVASLVPSLPAGIAARPSTIAPRPHGPAKEATSSAVRLPQPQPPPPLPPPPSPFPGDAAGAQPAPMPENHGANQPTAAMGALTCAAAPAPAAEESAVVSTQPVLPATPMVMRAPALHLCGIGQFGRGRVIYIQAARDAQAIRVGAWAGSHVRGAPLPLPPPPRAYAGNRRRPSPACGSVLHA